MSKRWLVLITSVAALSILGLFVAACGDNDEEQAAGVTSDGEQTFTVATSKDKLVFTPSTLHVKAGQPVKIMLDNSAGTVLHDFTVDEMHVSNAHSEGGAEHMMDGDDDDKDDDMPMGGSEMGMDGFALHVAADMGMMATIEFTPDEPGEYTYYCTVEGHRQAGMEGTLIVE
jgi:uncharacterized cupredoxin-like copper-binding protein